MASRKERVRKALIRTGPDRVPVFMWFHPSTARRLGRLLDIPAGAVAEAFGDDIRQTWVNNNYAMEGVVHEHENESHTDDWGITWTRQGDFNQITRFPLADASPDEVRQYRCPEDAMAFLLSRMDPVVARADEFIRVGQFDGDGEIDRALDRVAHAADAGDDAVIFLV